MKITEIISMHNGMLREAKVGRELQHLEDYLIVSGAEETLSVLQDLSDIISDTSDASVKWDGIAAIYWGHDAQGNFYLIPQNQWAKAQTLDQAGLRKEIESTGRPRADQRPEDFAKSRSSLAQKYLRLWDIFEVASKGTQGFFKGDLMFSEPQTPESDGNYVFTPNKVTYTVTSKGLYGKMPRAQAFVTVHGKAREPGSQGLSPVKAGEVDRLNSTPKLIALDAQRPQGKLPLKSTALTKLIGDVRKNSGAIDKISNFTAPGFTTIKSVLYNYAVKLGKSHDTLSFDDWLENPKTKVSDKHRSILQDLSQTPEWKTFWKIFSEIKLAKHSIHDALHKHQEAQSADSLGIRATTQGKPGGEGFVTSAGKIVNPYFRSAPDNPRFTGEA